MKTRYLLTLGLSALFAYLLGPGCTQDFDQFEPCKFAQKPCDNGCVSVSDPAHGCGTSACDPCQVPNATAVCDALECAIGSCTNGFENCDGQGDNGCEVDPETDVANCGACGNLCVVPHATADCQAGKCAVGMCDPDFGDCSGGASDGCESNLQNDPEHCGSCDNQCGPSQGCQGGQCVLMCPDGKGDCNNNPADGCETDFGTTLNCAFCGDTCDPANAAGACTAGMCVVENCVNGFGDCDNNPANGCEADLQGSALTCGTCNNACPNGPNGTTVCNGGSCAINCNAGFGNCDASLANGCETDVGTSAANCGGCNQACSPANGTGVCAGGMCGIMMCTGTFADCNMNAADGCEVDKSTSAQNCGMCGNMCSFPNAQATCAGGTCGLGMCNAGFGNCDGMAANGCEKPTSADVNNCGTCGNVCPGGANGTAACANGTCGLACDPGFGDCDGMAANGCETVLDTNVDNCGACGRACQSPNGTNVASVSCTGGVCDSTCDLSRANCSQPAVPTADNACEVNAATSNENCGGCGNTCAMQGNPASPLTCSLNVPGPQNLCGCQQSTQCDGDGAGGPAQGFCFNGTCNCGGTTCNPSEWCISSGGNNVCSCGTNAGGAACAAGQTCCVSPAGCFNLRTDPQSCGACGHACPAGFVCFDLGANAAPECRCDAAADCNAGTGGSFSCNGTGRCVCGGATCAQGERCQPDGTCG